MIGDMLWGTRRAPKRDKEPTPVEDLDALLTERDAREERNRQEREELAAERIRLLRIRTELAQIRRAE